MKHFCSFASSSIKPRTINQSRYVDLLHYKTGPPIVLATGPAGSGKTLLACNEGVINLKDGHYKKIVLTRPVQTVDEDIGFLPGDIDKKLDPWVKPLYDCFFNHYSYQKLSQMKTSGIIEIVPLAFMRGRTFDNAWIIADEMQNSTDNQLKMLVTRLGKDSKLIITGDVQQKDIHDSGLENFLENMYHDDLMYTKSIELCDEDISRHPAVKEMLDLYNQST
jgi:phosphate starvation-inducible PhoH-like protein